MGTDREGFVLEHAQREAKAAHLTTWLLLAQRTNPDGPWYVDDVVDYGNAQWALAAEAAHVGGKARRVGPKTRRMVIDALAHDADERLMLCATCGLGNPGGDVGPRLPVGHRQECRR